MVASVPYGVATQPVGAVIRQHGEESALLRNVRNRLVAAPHAKFRQLARLDDRIAAHLDGLCVAGESGWQFCESALEAPGLGEVFASAVRAIEDRHSQRIDRLFSLAEKAPEAHQGLTSAFGWTSVQFLQGTIKNLFGSTAPLKQCVGIACCAMHRVDPGSILTAFLQQADTALRARALRAAGELGRRDLLPACQYALQDKDETARFRAAWSAVLLGDRDKAVHALTTFASVVGPFRARALQLSLKAIELQSAHDLVKSFAADPKNIRAVIQGAGIAGDPFYVPWLIKQMDDLKLTRLAGESFSFITGLDLAYLDLERKPPENFESGPTDDPNDENVDMDPDDGLPWPDPVKIQKWWDANKHNFQNGVRYFMGKPLSVEHCKEVLKNGYQRQRIAAAQYLCLLQPGTVLFPTSAPAWRQKRLLEKL